MENKKELSLYIHIPFCKQKCFYCDFPSYASIDYLREDYVKALCKEIEEKAIDYKIKSIFIGGGTPSYLETKEIAKLLKTISKLDLEEGMEFTMECNPGALAEEKLKTMIEGGVNRISMGLQAVQNSLLKDIGRIHTFKEFTENFNLARKVGFKNINVDLMFGLPNQSFDEWKESLETIADLNPEHISAYSLIVEEGTAFYKLWERNKLILPTEEDERRMYSETKEILKAKGYHQYEISNYSKEGYECYHNKVYWESKNYLGVGSASTSFIDGKRIKNIENVKAYIDGIMEGKSIVLEENENSKEDNIEEFVFMGLRMIEGISKEEFKRRFKSDIYEIYSKEIEKNIENGLLLEVGDRLKLTEKGIEFSNLVMSDFIL
ncbi:oxygen-independent coproporphyrinogen III oxidase [Clostridium sartagoforme]|uniref:Heme chaperone HemW n=1 Tax=Clostridium sartagoforme TaxID=84031 RepID=A0A4S2DLW8_9CLOT|nr:MULTISPECIES: radical SAM family heme chaperone HemW [Clostridium]MBS5937182.1 oxygen-independent coproporphyrinogen III oxidase [Clostridium sp.]TGY43308.1 oxygen-independent coproporphyrinogen III oxidase [Clostridium sartagoforme]